MVLHVSKGSRVFLTSLKMFGEVKKMGALGTDAVVVQCDDGSLHVVCGENLQHDVVDKESSKNGSGSSVEIPTDVQVVGQQVLSDFGVDEETRAALFQKFMVLDEGVRLEKAAYWEANKDDKSKMNDFLSELLTLLESDTAFIQAKSAKLLGHLDTETRSTMLTNMMSSTTEAERKAMILQYTAIQNDRKQVAEFLQGMFELLLDNKTYIRNELRKALVSQEESTPMIEAFLDKSSEAEIDKLVEDWRKLKLYRSGAGGLYARKIVTKH